METPFEALLRVFTGASCSAEGASGILGSAAVFGASGIFGASGTFGASGAFGAAEVLGASGAFAEGAGAAAFRGVSAAGAERRKLSYIKAKARRRRRLGAD